jgi:hypothetical protein
LWKIIGKALQMLCIIKMQSSPIGGHLQAFIAKNARQQASFNIYLQSSLGDGYGVSSAHRA